MVDDVVRARLKPRLYDFSFLILKSNLNTFMDLIKSLDKDAEEIKILDLGCGQKPFEKLISEMFKIKKYVYTGVDISQNSKADYILDLNNEKLPFSDGTFDLVIISETLEHLYNTQNVLDEVYRVLKTGGYVFISTPFVFYNHGEPYDFYRFTDYYYQQVAQLFRYKIVKLEKAGSLISVTFFTINLMLQRIPRIPKIIKMSVYIISNIIALSLDKFSFYLVKKLKCKRCYKHLSSFYCGISVVLKKM